MREENMMLPVLTASQQVRMRTLEAMGLGMNWVWQLQLLNAMSEEGRGNVSEAEATGPISFLGYILKSL
jgi:hypothetical protein